MSDEPALPQTSKTVIELMTSWDFTRSEMFEGGCSAWGNDVAHDFSYPPIESDHAKRAELEARIKAIEAWKPKKKSKTKPQSEDVTDALVEA